MALTTMYAAQTNSPTTTLASAAGAADTSLIVTSAAVLPSTTPFELSLGIGEAAAETVLVTAVNGNTLTVTRGWDGTPQAWAVNTVCARTFSARDLNDMQGNILALQSDMAAMVDSGLTEQGKAADAYTTGRALYRTKDRDANTAASYTYWNAVTAGYSSDNPVAPANMPLNTYTYASGALLAGFNNDLFTLSTTNAYFVWSWASLFSTPIREFIIIGGNAFYFGRSTNIGTTPVTWRNALTAVDDTLAVSGAAADAATVGNALYGNKSRTANVPGGLTFVKAGALKTELGVDTLSPTQIPPNSFTYTTGDSLNLGLDLVSSRGYWLFKFRSSLSSAATTYLVWSASGGEIYVGQTISSASSITWLDASPKRPTLKLAMFGDSIMRGIVNPPASGKNNDDNIPNGVARELGIITGNFGIGSIGWINSSSDENRMPAYGYLKAFAEGDEDYYGDYPGPDASYSGSLFIGKGTLADYNAVLLAYGANDGSATLGTLASVQAHDGLPYDPDNIGYNTTIIEQVYRCVRYLRSLVPNLPIILMGPYVSMSAALNTGDGTWNVVRAGGYTKAQYAALLKEFAEYYGCGYIDMHNMPRNPFDLSQSLTANVHPTAACYHEIAKYVAGHLGII